MRLDNEMVDTLVATLAHHQDTVRVYRISRLRLDELEAGAVKTLQGFLKDAGLDGARYEMVRCRDRTRILAQEGLAGTLFHASGALALDRGWNPMSKAIGAADRIDEAELRSQAEAAVQTLELGARNDNEQLRFERLWKVKAAGITVKGERGPVTLTRAIGAFRRHLDGVPVWGRASVVVELAGGGEVAAAGVDWRAVAKEPIDEPKVLPPEDAARRVVGELQSFRPGEPFTLKDYTPEFFALGYLSLPRRRLQTVMQPVYVAMFTPTRPFPSRGRLITVPAAPAAYEPICRPMGAPPPAVKKSVA